MHTTEVAELGHGNFIQLLEIEYQFETIFHSRKIVSSTLVVYIRELVDSVCRDGANMPIKS